MPDRRGGKRDAILTILGGASEPMTSHQIGALIENDPNRLTWSAYVPLQSLVAEGLVRRHQTPGRKRVGYSLAGTPATPDVEVLTRALARRAEIVRELEDVDRFIELHRRLFVDEGSALAAHPEAIGSRPR